MATILIDAPLPFKLEDLVYHGYSFQDVNTFCQKYELKQLPSRLPSFYKQQEESVMPEVSRVSTLPKIDAERVGLVLDLPSKLYHEDDALGLAVATKGAVYYLEAEQAKTDPNLKELLTNPSIKKSVYDLKATLIGLERLGLPLEGADFDLLLSAYVLDPSLTEAPEVVYSYFGIDVSVQDEKVDLFTQNRPEFTAKMAYFASVLRNKALKELSENEAIDLFNNVEVPLSSVLAKMELEGFPLNKNELLSIGESYRAKRDEIEKEVHALAGYSFNVASPKQVGELLFEKLNLADGKAPGTSVEVLRSIESKHPVVGKILEYRKYAKLVSTYIDGLVPHIKDDGKIHTYFNQALTSTGRLSSSNPNLQNISTRDPESKEIRKAFHYEDPNLCIASFDYGQIELRVLAALSHCQSYIDVFSQDRDVHEETARRIFNVPEGMEVPSILRRKAKAVNFAIIYGVTPFGLAEQIGSYPKEAAELISSFKTHYPEIEAYLQSILKEVEEKGYVKTMFGRRRYLRDVTDANYAKREAARRAALNAPVQGSAADLIKVAMIKVDKALREGGYKTKMVLQIHDELLFAMPKEEVDTLCPIIEKIMTEAVALPVKLTVDGSYGRTWYDAKD